MISGKFLMRAAAAIGTSLILYVSTAHAADQSYNRDADYRDRSHSG